MVTTSYSILFLTVQHLCTRNVLLNKCSILFYVNMYSFQKQSIQSNSVFKNKTTLQSIIAFVGLINNNKTDEFPGRTKTQTDSIILQGVRNHRRFNLQIIVMGCYLGLYFNKFRILVPCWLFACPLIVLFSLSLFYQQAGTKHQRCGHRNKHQITLSCATNLECRFEIKI